MQLSKWLMPLAMSAAAAAQTAPTKIGIINIQAAIASTKDGQKTLQDLEAQFAPKKKEIEKRQQAIQAKQAQLQKGGSVLGDDQKRKLMAEIDQDTKNFNRDVEDASAELEQAQGRAFQTLSQNIMGVIDKLAKDRGYAVIIDVSSQQTPVLYAANEVDITKDVIEAYDKSGPAAVAPAAKPPAVKPLVSPPATKK